jgi:hypothetical protein
MTGVHCRGQRTGQTSQRRSFRPGNQKPDCRTLGKACCPVEIQGPGLPNKPPKGSVSDRGHPIRGTHTPVAIRGSGYLQRH